MSLQTNKEENVEIIPSIQLTYRPYDIRNICSYNPYFSLFFPDLPFATNAPQHIAFPHKYHLLDLSKLDKVFEINTNGEIVGKKTKDVFIKFSPLIDPIHYLTGKYSEDAAETVENLHVLPNGLNYELLHPKIKCIHNASYVDNFFNFLSSTLLNKHKFPHGIDYYGSYLGIQQDYKINVEDDFEYISNHIFFEKHYGKLFAVNNLPFEDDTFSSDGKGGAHPPILLNDEISEINTPIIEVDTSLDDTDGFLKEVTTIDNADTILEEVYENMHHHENANTNKSANYYSSSNSSYTSASSSSSTEKDNDISSMEEENDEEEREEEHGEEKEEEEEEYEDEEAEDENTDLQAYIKNFPVQMICLEKCEGTLDELFESDEMNEETGLSMLFQIIMSLLTYQKAFNFTHNDLHTNNIMYVHTKQKYIYYKFEGIVYQVPTYGKIFKMIDFGRAIYQFEEHLFCSDSFSHDGDANTQYNFEPFLNPRKPIVYPNKSFDLCRLGCSIYDFIIDKHDKGSLDDFQTIIDEWCTGDDGKNLIYKRHGKDRFPGFKLYRVIAHKVTQHKPYNQLERPVFQKYICNTFNATNEKEVMKKVFTKVKKNGAVFFDVDTIQPLYIVK